MTQEVLSSLKEVVKGISQMDAENPSIRVNAIYFLLKASNDLETLSQAEKTDLNLFSAGVVPEIVERANAQKAAGKKWYRRIL